MFLLDQRRDPPVRGADYEPVSREQNREVSNRRTRSSVSSALVVTRTRVRSIRAQQRYAFQIVRIRILLRRLIDEQRHTTDINNRHNHD